MRPTSLGLGCLGLGLLCLAGAGATGNNLLYLLFGVLASALALSAAVGRLNLRRLAARLESSGQVFRGDLASLRVAVRNQGRWTARAVALSWQGRGRSFPPLAAGAQTAVVVRGRLAHRGRNRLEGLRLESAFPFALLLHRRAVDLTVLAWPRLHEVRSAAEAGGEAGSGARPALRRGSGDELYGVRDYEPSDESRLINWKLTAKTGRTLVNEFCAFEEEKVTVRLPGLKPAETAIEDAASACRFYIDSGAQVRLITCEGALDYGRGRLHLERMLDALALLGPGKTPRSTGSPERGPGFRVQDSQPLRRLSWWLGALLFAALSLIDEVSPRVLAALAPLFPLSWWWRRRGAARPPAWLGDCFSAAVLAVVLLWGWRALGVVVANVYLVLYLLLNRVLGQVESEELGGLFLVEFLTLFLVSGLTISLWYFAVILLYLGLAAAWLMAAAGADPRQGRAWLPAWSGLLGAGLLLSAVFFAVTPRSEGYRRINPFLAAGMDKLTARGPAVTGFTENVALGQFGELKKSSARVMRVQPPPGGQGNRPPVLHIRGAAFDAFDGRRWSRTLAEFRYRREGRLCPSTAGVGWLARQNDSLLFPSPSAGPAAPVYDFMIYPIGLSVLFTVGTPASAEGISAAASFDADDSVHLAAPYLRGLRYQLRLSPGPGGLALPRPGHEAARDALFLQLPSDLSPRFFALAQRIAAGAPDEAAKARAVERYLRRSLSYSSFSDSRRRGLEDFLFSTKRGNCEYFATAGVLLLRAMGVRARLATGFLAEDWNEYGRFYDVRQSAAHAWGEVFLPGRGWVGFDPTPAAGFSASAQALGLRLSRLFDAAQSEWYRRVIGYDQFTQRDTFRRLGLAFSAEALLSRTSPALKPLLALAAGLGLLLGLGGLRRLRSPAGDYARASAALARAGLARLAFQTPREHARTVVARRPDLAALAPLVELHYLDRYGPGLAAPQRSESRRLLLELRRRL